MFLWALVWAVIGFISTWIWGFDVPKFVSDIIILFLIPVIFIIFGGYKNLDLVIEFIINYIFMIPGILIGDVVGSFVAKFAGLFGKSK